MSLKPIFRRTKSIWPLCPWTQCLPPFPGSSSSVYKTHADFICNLPIQNYACAECMTDICWLTLETVDSSGRLLCVGSPHAIHYVSTACLVEPNLSSASTPVSYFSRDHVSLCSFSCVKQTITFNLYKFRKQNCILVEKLLG